MLSDSPGIHHVTAIVRDAQRNVDFYVGVLGLRLVKRTVNYEDMLRYHLYYGNRTGDIGTLLTCFPYPNEVAGRVGKPQITSVAFVIPDGAVSYWVDRLDAHDVDVTGPIQRFDETVLRFEGPAGTTVELVTGESPIEPWTEGPVPADVGIRGIHSVTALPTNPYSTASMLETLGYELVGQESDPEPPGDDVQGDADRIRYQAGGEYANVIDILDRPAEYGREGHGTVQHVAVRVENEAELYEWHDLFRDRDYNVSRVRDRNYFHSLYVREPGGILFELATEGRGLTADEDVETLGESLVLPEWFEEDRELIEDQLPPIELPTE